MDPVPGGLVGTFSLGHPIKRHGCGKCRCDLPSFRIAWNCFILTLTDRKLGYHFLRWRSVQKSGCSEASMQ
jgi:hypothetical protein